MLFLSSKSKKKENREFKKTVLAMDRGKKWAKREMQSLAQKDDEDFVARLAQARLELYSQAAYEGNDNAQYLVGMSYKQLEDREAALEWLTMQAKKGDVKSMKALAQGYTKEGLFGDNRIEYICWLRKAAQAGDVWAQVNLGREYNGKNEEAARKWYQAAKAQGSSEACLELGRSWYHEAITKFGIQNPAEKQKLMDLVEEHYIEAANRAKDAHELAVASRELGNFYSTAFQGDVSPERAAWYYYQAWNCERKSDDFEQFEKIRKQYQLDMAPERMDEWEEKLFGNDERI